MYEGNLHEKLTAWTQSLMRPRGVSREAQARLIRRTRERSESPDFRPEYFKGMIGGWMMAEVVAILATGVAGAIASSVGRIAARVTVATGSFGIAFCVAGVFAAIWWYYAAKSAAREARRSGVTSERYLRLSRRARSSALTLWYQGMLGVVVAVLVFLK